MRAVKRVVILSSAAIFSRHLKHLTLDPRRTFVGIQSRAPLLILKHSPGALQTPVRFSIDS
jgi:hypothetical protein